MDGAQLCIILCIICVVAGIITSVLNIFTPSKSDLIITKKLTIGSGTNTIILDGETGTVTIGTSEKNIILNGTLGHGKIQNCMISNDVVIPNTLTVGLSSKFDINDLTNATPATEATPEIPAEPAVIGKPAVPAVIGKPAAPAVPADPATNTLAKDAVEAVIAKDAVEAVIAKDAKALVPAKLAKPASAMPTGVFISKDTVYLGYPTVIKNDDYKGLMISKTGIESYPIVASPIEIKALKTTNLEADTGIIGGWTMKNKKIKSDGIKDMTLTATGWTF